MSSVPDIFVSRLRLDLNNPRWSGTAKDELEAIYKNISYDPMHFEEILHGLYNEEYDAAEGNIVVQPTDESNVYLVRNGNTRISALKMLLGQVKPNKNILTLLKKRSQDLIGLAQKDTKWKKNNRQVPCVIRTPQKASEKVLKIHTSEGKAKQKNWRTINQNRHLCDEGKASQKTQNAVRIFDNFIESDFFKEKLMNKQIFNKRKKKEELIENISEFERIFPFLVFRDVAIAPYLEATKLTFDLLAKAYPKMMKEEDQLALEDYILKLSIGVITKDIAKKYKDGDLRKILI